MNETKKRVGEVITETPKPLGTKVLGIKFPFTLKPIRNKVFLRMLTLAAEIEFEEKEDLTVLNLSKNLPLMIKYIAAGLANGNFIKYWVFKKTLHNRNKEELAILYLDVKKQSDPTVFFYLLKGIKASDQILMKSQEETISLGKSPAQKKS